MNIYDQFNRPEKVYEINSGKKLFEKGCVKSNKVRIEEFIAAGVRLQASRAEQYDFPPGKEVDEDFQDPTRRKNFDRVDVGIAINYLKAKALEEKQKKEEEKNDTIGGKDSNPIQGKVVVPPDTSAN